MTAIFSVFVYRIILVIENQIINYIIESLILNIILGSNKNINVINIFEKIKNNKQFKIRIHKSLSEHIKNENTHYQSTEFDLLYEEMVKQKLNNYTRLIDLRKKEKNYEKKKLRDKKWQDKVVRSKIKAYYLLIRDFNKYYKMRNSFNLIETKNKMKNKLYEIIFKGTRFWKGLGFFLELVGICAAGVKILVVRYILVYFLLYIIVGTNFLPSTAILTKILEIFSPYLILFSGIYGVCILLIIITVVVVVLLVVWLWPRGDENSINKILEAK
ncbi:Hypotetical protein, putative [Plasmodium sp. gorilla clade G3]|nr:Hypotetical protein, putative [Plasmodium sp. gorilla clade G3]